MAQILAIYVAWQFYHLVIIFIFFFDIKFSVGAGGAGSIDLHIKSSEATEFFNLWEMWEQGIGGTYQKNGTGAAIQLFCFGG